MAKAKQETITVVFKGRERVFTRDIHGDDFEKVVATFIESNGGEIKIEEEVV